MKRLVAYAFFSGLVAASACAQLVPGRHLVVSSHRGVFAVDRTNGALATIVTENTAFRFHAITMDKGNQSMVALFTPTAGAKSYLMRVYPNGSASTVMTLPGTANGLALDQDGQWLIPTQEGNLFRTIGLFSDSGITTIATGLNSARGICVDGETGDYIVSGYTSASAGTLFRIDRRTSAVSTIARGLPQIGALRQSRRDGRFLAQTASALYRVSPVSAPTYVTNSARGSTIHCDSVAGESFVGNGDEIHLLNASYATVRVLKNAAIGSINGITVYGSRKAYPSTTNTCQGGTFYKVSGNFTESPNAGYVCGISLGGMRPGLSIGGTQRINIVPDALLLHSALTPIPLFTKRFTGTTSASGLITAEFLLPPTSPTFPPITFAAVAVNPAKPGGLDIAETLSVKIVN